MSTSRREKLRRQALHQKQKEDRKYEQLFREVSCRKQEFKTYAPKSPYFRETQAVKSFTSETHSPNATAKRESQQYTGDLITGIATMHKSNAVPVLNQEDATEIANMRRN